MRALTHALNEQRLHHAYLFTGTRGVGKTTLARILAKSLNCETGITATPCGKCSACTEIDAGRFVDLLEVDAATNTRVDEMRQLLENAVYAPTRGRFKVYVIDEVHMLSNSAFNAMLKTLEEPPEHVKFILATTDPQKIPVTVLSRCLQFNLKQMTPPLIAAHLERILKVESISAEPGALNLLSRSAAGSMRDALSLLDQAIAHGSGRVEEVLVREMLGTVDLDYLFSILDALIAGDASEMLRVADDMTVRSLSFDAALQELASLFTRLQVAQLAPKAIAEDIPERAKILEVASKFDPEYVQLGYQIAVHGRKELPLAPDDQSGFVMTLLRLFAFRPADAAISDRGVKTNAIVGMGARPAADASRSPTTQGKSSQTPPPDQKTSRFGQESPADYGGTSRERAVTEDVEAEVSRPLPVPETDAFPDAAREGKDWTEIISVLNVGGMARELGQHCQLKTLNETQVVLSLAPVHRHLQIKPAQDKLQQALSEYFGRSLRLVIGLEEISGDTPAAVAQRRRQERQDEAVASVEQDPFVREVIDIFDATLIDLSIKPV